jgi:uncharacterized protein
MHRSAASTILSPSDLVTHLACAHATELDRRVVDGELTRPDQHDPDLDVLRRRGDEHERAQLAAFVAAGRSVVEIRCAGSGVDDLVAAEADTLAAMRAGADVVFQATFFDGRWRGHADFLLRSEVPSELGGWSYDVADAKLARRVKPSALVQLCAYAEQVARLQGAWPDSLVVITGDGVHHRHPAADVAAYHRLVKDRFERVMDSELEPTAAVPVEHCGVCPWAPRCEAGWRAADDLHLIAGVGGGAAAALSAAGITSGALLAASADGTPVEGMQLEVADRLRRQARLQLAQRRDGVVRHELLAPEVAADPGPGHDDGDPGPPAPPRGLAALPAPSPGDLFFDIEGDPWVGEHGIEYLFGVVEAPTATQPVPAYVGFWGHDPVGEKLAFEQLVDLVIGRLDAHPAMHVYHYAAYERSVLQRLAGRYDTRHAEVDRILRGDVLVDLYRVVRHAVLVSQEGYGLKKLEPLYLPADLRSGEAVTDGGSSIAVYEEWLESGDPARLEEIRAYNEVDCRSTLGLRDWLEQRRVDLARQTGSPVPRPGPVEGKASARVTEADERREAAVVALLAGVPDDPAARTPRSGGASSSPTCSAGTVARSDPAGGSGSTGGRRTRPPSSPTARPWAASSTSASSTRRARGSTTTPSTRLRSTSCRRARTWTTRPRGGGRDGSSPSTWPAAGSSCSARPARPRPTPPRSCRRHPCARRSSRMRSRPSPGTSLPTVSAVAVVVVAGRGGRGSTSSSAARPGPRVTQARCSDPGRTRGTRSCGWRARSTTAASPSRARRARARRTTAPKRSSPWWRRAGGSGSPPTATPPAANLLEAVCVEAEQQRVRVRALQRCEEDRDCRVPGARAATNAEVDEALAAGEVDVVAGTAWLFARPELRATLDVLFVDEAGQLSLASTLSVSGAARGLVLLGDPQQLAQPSKGAHPDGSDVSALDHVLAGSATIAPDLGLFLDRSHRMHPDICHFVSTLAYDDRLRPAPGCERCRVDDGPVVGGAGLRWLPVEHTGNRTRSVEEAEVVAGAVAALLGRTTTDRCGRRSTVTPGRHPRDRPVQRAGRHPGVGASRRRPRRHRRPVPGPGGAGGGLLARRLLGRRRPPGHRVPPQHPPPQRRRLPGAGAVRPRRQPRPPAGARAHAPPAPAGQRAVPVRRAGRGGARRRAGVRGSSCRPAQAAAASARARRSATAWPRPSGSR